MEIDDFYPIEDGLNHDNKDDEDDHVPVDVRVGIAFALVVSHHFDAVLQLRKPVGRWPLQLLDRAKQFGQFAEN